MCNIYINIKATLIFFLGHHLHLTIIDSILTFKAFYRLVTSIHRHNNSSLFVRHFCVFFCTGIKTGFYFFFKEPQLHYQDMSECLPFNRIYKHVSEFQTTDQFTNHCTYWIETNVLYSVKDLSPSGSRPVNLWIVLRCARVWLKTSFVIICPNIDLKGLQLCRLL